MYDTSLPIYGGMQINPCRQKPQDPNSRECSLACSCVCVCASLPRATLCRKCSIRNVSSLVSFRASTYMTPLPLPCVDRQCHRFPLRFRHVTYSTVHRRLRQIIPGRRNRYPTPVVRRWSFSAQGCSRHPGPRRRLPRLHLRMQ